MPELPQRPEIAEGARGFKGQGGRRRRCGTASNLHQAIDDGFQRAIHPVETTEGGQGALGSVPDMDFILKPQIHIG